MRRLILLTCLLAVPIGAAKNRTPTLAESIDTAIASSPNFASAFLGIQIVRLSDGKVLYERNPDHLFIPASNTKLFSTALALKRLGPDYRFTTSILADQPIDVQGTLNGDLILVGRGDPSLSGRAYPYTTDPVSGDVFKPIEDLADQVAAGGLKSIRGDIVGDDTRYTWLPYPGSWSANDGLFKDGAPVSALIVNDNEFRLTVQPGSSEGDLAEIFLTPAFEFFSMDNRVRTTAGGERKIHIDGSPGIPELRVWGTIPLGAEPDTSALAIADPAVFAAAVLRQALIQRGVAVSGRAVARHRFADDEAGPEPAGTELARRKSPPLIQLLQVVDKASQNLHAEILLREVGAVRHDKGLDEMRDFLTHVGIEENEYALMDGSGMSRTNLVSPHAVIKLLSFMYASPYRDRWIELLPIAGADGTLRRRFKGHPEAAGIHAKTGSLSHVRALSGYADTKRHGRLAFSILLNNYNAPDGEVARFLDNIGLKLLP